jgi:hypothetical protein
VKINGTVLAALLLIGIVDQISANTALIEYEKDGRLSYSYISLDLSACNPVEGQTVHFFEDYKIVSCEEGEEEE